MNGAVAAPASNARPSAKPSAHAEKSEFDLRAATIPFEKYKLPNGLTVILHTDKSLPLVAVNVWYH
ncbi:MAG TPA: insulinase family protein, partial [Polyangiaceae bacterium]